MAASSEDNNIDLYADSEGLSQLDLSLELEEMKNGKNADLFDSVVVSALNNQPAEIDSCEKPVTKRSMGDDNAAAESRATGENAPTLAPHKFHVFLGGLTWWTSDKQVEDLLTSIGVDDIIEIKFFDNRTNGQSKGYCNVCVSSERSIRLIHEKVAKKSLEGRQIIVAPPTKSSTAQFEAQAECLKPKPPGPAGSPVGCPPRGQNGSPGVPPGYGPGPGGPRMMGTPRRHSDNPPNQHMFPPPPHQGPPPGMGPHHMNYPGPRAHGMPPYPPHPQRPFRPYFHPGQNPNPNSMYAPVSAGMDHRSPHPPRPEWSRTPGGPPRLQGPSPHHPMHQHSPRGPPMQPLPPHLDGQGSPPGMLPIPHVNPAFFHPDPQNFASPIVSPEGTPGKVQVERGPPLLAEPYQPSPPGVSSVNRTGHPSCHDLSEREVAEIISRNRAVCGSAIARAVSDASKGDYASAIETLVTAVSLIRQSRVGKDDRCRILISSLQDTLRGIENKGYGRHKPSRSRVSRSRSRERSSHRSRRHYRSRSHSRERSRDRYYSSRRSRTPTSPRGSKHDERERNRDRNTEQEGYRRERDHHEMDNERQIEIISRTSSGRNHDRIDDHHHHDREYRSSSRR